MRKIVLLSIVFILIFDSGCEKDNQKLILSQNDTLSFSGTFRFTDSLTNLGTVTLKTSLNYYYCTTSLPFGYGAGNIQVNETSVYFKDTLFFAVPALYGPAYVLTGKCNYQYDGQNLSIKTDRKSNNLIYNLKLKR